MKDKIKKIVMPIFLSVFCGFVCGKMVFGIYEEKGNSLLNSNLIYLLEDSSYDNYDSMKANTVSSDYIYYEEDGMFNAVVAMTKNRDNIKKIEEVYNKELKVSEYLIDDIEIIEVLNEYDVKLENTEDKDEIRDIVIDMISVYKDVDDIKMVKIS